MKPIGFNITTHYPTDSVQQSRKRGMLYSPLRQVSLDTTSYRDPFFFSFTPIILSAVLLPLPLLSLSFVFSFPSCPLMLHVLFCPHVLSHFFFLFHSLPYFSMAPLDFAVPLPVWPYSIYCLNTLAMATALHCWVVWKLKKRNLVFFWGSFFFRLRLRSGN